jgi:small nuclear ribonucleoprotein E
MAHPLALLENQKKTRVRVWLYEDTKTQLEGQIIGFDEYMNMVLDDAVEIGGKQGRSDVGRILLKGDAITLIQEAQPEKQEEQQQ